MKVQHLRLDELQIDGFGHFHENAAALRTGTTVGFPLFGGRLWEGLGLVRRNHIGGARNGKARGLAVIEYLHVIAGIGPGEIARRRGHGRTCSGSCAPSGRSAGGRWRRL